MIIVKRTGGDDQTVRFFLPESRNTIKSNKCEMQPRRVDSYAIAKTSKLWVFPLVSMEKLAMTRKLKKGACKQFGSMQTLL